MFVDKRERIMLLKYHR